ncbi:MAG: HD domain-containing protein [Clostridia bacterium]|nr:HD domain-containing protein [Clostridia bacterium]MBR6564286.1 HD domain-containing protein [Clostridia bacterium]
MEKNRFDRQVDFILELDKEKNILRQNHLSGYVRRENDAEHAWHMAIMVYLLKEYANKDFDIAKAMMMALIHDVVEIDAGDTYAYDPKAKLDQKEREDKAAQRIFSILPDDQRDELKALFYEFEACESAEAKFVRAMDNFQPLLLNDINNGEDWRLHGVTMEQIMNRQKRSAEGSNTIWEETYKIIEKNLEKGNIKKD